MGSINKDAIDGLAVAIESLLPEVTDPAMQPDVMVLPECIRPTGLGGFICLNEDPRGEILGRYLKAKVMVTARADSVSNLGNVQTAITHALLGVDRSTLSKSGIFSVSLHEIGPQLDNGTAEQELTFEVAYEFLKRPDEAQGIIQKIPVIQVVSQTGNISKILISTPFIEDPMSWFEVIDDPGITQFLPSQWGYNAAEARIEQLSRAHGASYPADAGKPGTYLVLRTNPTQPVVQDFSLNTILRSKDERGNGIGLVFRWQDVDNFYFFLMKRHENYNYRLIRKKVGGVFQDLDVAALDEDHSYVDDVFYSVRLNAQGPIFQVYLDGELALHGQDASLSEPGRVGFMCHGNNEAYFYRIDLVQI